MFAYSTINVLKILKMDNIFLIHDSNRQIQSARIRCNVPNYNGLNGWQLHTTETKVI